VTSPYRRVLATPGALAFSSSGLLARLPISMIGLGIVLLVSNRTGSYSQAGALSAVYIASNALVAVFLARLVDRRGQTVLGIAASVSAIALASSVLAVEYGWAAPLPHVFAALAGASLPNVGAAVRARWSHVLEDRRLLDTAFAVEAVNDEVVFVVGPTLVTLLASAVDPVVGLAAAGAASLTGTWLLVTQRRTEPPRQRPDSLAGPRTPMPWGRLAPLVAGGLMLGVMFGGTEVAAVAFADEAGRPAAAGVLLALWALGSLIAGVVSGGLTFTRPPAVRYLIGVCALAVLMVPLPFVEGLVPLGVLLFLAGFAISPTMIAAVSWIEMIVPRDRLNEGMTIFSTGMVAGVAPGAAFVGVAIDQVGASRAFWVPVAAGLVAAVVATVSTAVLGGTRPTPSMVGVADTRQDIGGGT
jgi:predicted MFS family arabinose efflux permease